MKKTNCQHKGWEVKKEDANGYTGTRAGGTPWGVKVDGGKGYGGNGNMTGKVSKGGMYMNVVMLLVCCNTIHV